MKPDQIILSKLIQNYLKQYNIWIYYLKFNLNQIMLVSTPRQTKNHSDLLPNIIKAAATPLL